MANLMSLLVVVDRAKAFSGPHRNVVSTINGLSQRPEIELTLLTNDIDESAPYFKKGKVNYILGFNPHGPNVLKNWSLFRRAIQNQDLIYVPTGLKSFLYSWLNKKGRKLVAGPNVTGIPLLMDIYDPSPIMTSGMADGWIEMSNLRYNLCIRKGTSPDRVTIVPHAMDKDLFHPSKKDPSIWDTHGIPKDSFKLIHIGRFDEERKGGDVLIESFLKFRKKRPEAWLVLIGNTDGLDPSKLTRENGVVQLGRIENNLLPVYYASSDLFIGTSRFETFWFTPLEAMSCGIPVFVTPTGAVDLMITEDGKEGVILPIVENDQFIENPTDIVADRLLRAVEGTSELIDMGRRGRERVEAYFYEERLSEDLYQYFKKFVS